MKFYIIILLFCKLIFILATTKINLLYINDNHSKVANFSINSAIQYFKRNHNITINKKVITGEIYNYEESLSTLCDWYSISAAKREMPDIILDVTKIGDFSQGVQAFASCLDIPFVTTSYESNSNFQIYPPANVIPSLIRTIAVFQEFSTVVVLADDSYVLDHKYKYLLQNIPTRHTIDKIDIHNNIQQLLRIKKMKLYNVFLLGSLKIVEHVLSNAEAISMFAKVYSWHVITHESGILKCDCREAKIFFAQPQNIFFETNGNFLKNLGFEEDQMLFGFFYFQVSYITMLAIRDLYGGVKLNVSFEKCEEFEDNNNTRINRINFKSAFVKELDTLNLEPTIILPENDVGFMNFSMDLSMIHFKEAIQFQVDNLGYWEINNKSLHIDDPTKFRDYMPPTSYRIVTRIHPPFIYKNESDPKKYYGLCIDLINDIADELGFDYEIIEVVDGQVGYLLENGHWNGMINELVTNRADIAIGAISVTSGRESVVDFTVPFYEMIGHSILMKYPKSSYNLFRFLEGFDHQLWLIICLLYFFTSVFIWVSYKFSPFGEQFFQKHRNKNNIRDFKLLDCLFFCLTSGTRMGGGRAPSNISSRLISGVWWFFIFIISSSYTANLAAVLTIQRFEFPIRSLDDLEKQYKITYAPLNGSDTMIYFKRMAYIESIFRDKWLNMNLDDDLPPQTRSKFSVWEYPLSTKYTNMWLRMQGTSFPSTNEEALRLIRASRSTDSGFAFLLDAIDAKYFELINCDLEVISEFNKRPLALAVQKGSVLKDKLNNMILNMYNTRAINMIKDKWWTNNPNRVYCNIDYDYQSLEGIIMQNMGGIFIFLFVGLFIMLLILSTKYFWAKYRNKQIIIVEPA